MKLSVYHVVMLAIMQAFLGNSLQAQQTYEWRGLGHHLDGAGFRVWFEEHPEDTHKTEIYAEFSQTVYAEIWVETGYVHLSFHSYFATTHSYEWCVENYTDWFIKGIRIDLDASPGNYPGCESDFDILQCDFGNNTSGTRDGFSLIHTSGLYPDFSIKSITYAPGDLPWSLNTSFQDIELISEREVFQGKHTTRPQR